MNKKKLGNLGELFAKHYLILKGYKIIETNYLINRYGEIDIIATKNKAIYFVEVKTRTKYKNKSYGTAVDAVDYNKINRMKYAINYFLINNGYLYKKYKKKLIVITIEIGYIHLLHD